MEIKHNVAKIKNRMSRYIDKTKEVANETKRIRLYQDSAAQQLKLIDYFKKKTEGDVYPLDRIDRLSEDVARLEEMFWEMGYSSDIQIRPDEQKLRVDVYVSI